VNKSNTLYLYIRWMKYVRRPR